MRLYLVNDLPLFGVVDDGHARELLVREEVRRLDSFIPASLTYLGFDDVERLWAKSVSTPFDVLVLVGTRPPCLFARWPRIRNGAALVTVDTRRTLDPRGRTESVMVTFNTQLDRLGEADELCIIDDVVMSGTTLRTVLAALRQHRSRGSISIRALIATAWALERIRANCPTADIRAETVLDFKPVEQGTVIFLWDLLYGTLRGRPFLSQIELLWPFFGRDLSTLHQLRRTIEDGGAQGR